MTKDVGQTTDEMDRRLLCQPRHLLHTRQGYSVYAYGDVFAPDGTYLGHSDELDGHEGLPFELQVLWNGFVKYWHGGDDLDRWDDGSSAEVLLDHTTGRYVLEDDGVQRPGSFATVGEAMARADSVMRDMMSS